MEDYKFWTIWMVIKRFLIGWGIAGGVLVIYSCVKYKEFIMNEFADNMLAMSNTAMLMAISVAGLFFQ